MTDYEHIDCSSPDNGIATVTGREPVTGGREYVLEIVAGPRGLNARAGNADVIITFDDGERRTATFITLENMRQFFLDKQDAPPHEAYVWANNMIVVRSIDPEHLANTVQSMMRRNEFRLAFGFPPDL